MNKQYWIALAGVALGIHMVVQDSLSNFPLYPNELIAAVTAIMGATCMVLCDHQGRMNLGWMMAGGTVVACTLQLWGMQVILPFHLNVLLYGLSHCITIFLFTSLLTIASKSTKLQTT
jgi:hypothetical protein